MTQTKEIVLSKEENKAIETAITRKITSPEEMSEAVTILSTLNQTSDRLTEDKEKLTSLLLNKYLTESDIMGEEDYSYIKSVIGTVKDSIMKQKLYQMLTNRFAYQKKGKKNS